MIARAALAFAALVASATAAWAGVQDFVLINRTGYTIEQVYVSPSNQDEWQEDVLGRNVLADGERSEIRFDWPDDTCLWDLRAVYDDGETAEWYGLNLCRTSVVALTYDANSGETTAEWE